MEDTKALAAPGQYLGLFIGGEEYSLGILSVREILQYEPLTRVPGTPPSIRGVLNVRGHVVPVVDLAVKFGYPEATVTARSCIVIVEARIDDESTVMGLMADAVSQVADLRAEDIQPPPPFGTRVHVDYLLGMGRAGRRFSLILDVDRVLSADEIAAVQEVPLTPEAAAAPLAERPAAGA
ncbi:MAG: chemotaxis protein CheW [Vicinamibacteria bacterium]|nr:chemotaxis protein CheW [Vicinamibacteria bacterium]